MQWRARQIWVASGREWFCHHLSQEESDTCINRASIPLHCTKPLAIRTFFYHNDNKSRLAWNHSASQEWQNRPQSSRISVACLQCKKTATYQGHWKEDDFWKVQSKNSFNWVSKERFSTFALDCVARQGHSLHTQRAWRNNLCRNSWQAPERWHRESDVQDRNKLHVAWSLRTGMEVLQRRTL